MLRQEEISEKSYELKWLEAVRQLALLGYAGCVWLHGELNNDNQGTVEPLIEGVQNG